VDVLSNPAILLLHCGTKATRSLLALGWKNLSLADRERQRVWNLLSKLNTCGIAPIRTRKEMARISFHKS